MKSRRWLQIYWLEMNVGKRVVIINCRQNVRKYTHLIVKIQHRDWSHVAYMVEGRLTREIYPTDTDMSRISTRNLNICYLVVAPYKSSGFVWL